VKTFSVFLTLKMDLQSDVFRDDIRNRIAAAFDAEGEIVDFYASQEDDPDAHSRLWQHLMKRRPRGQSPKSDATA
jgi:hypothetical protein